MVRALFRIGLPVLVAIILIGLIGPLVLRSRATADRVRCQSHLRDLGLLGVRHASPPGVPLPDRVLNELPPGTFPSSLPVTERPSWYAYTLNVLNDGVPSVEPAAKHRSPSGLADRMKSFDPLSAWSSPANQPLADHRLTTALCPATIDSPTGPPHANYLAVGGLGIDAPTLAFEVAGPRAGAYRYDGQTFDRWIVDGLRQSAQIFESNVDLGPWLQGGPSSLRGLDPKALPYVGNGRPIGGCHAGGAFLSMADGSTQFVKDTISPHVLRAMFTIAGGPQELAIDDQ